MRGAVGASRRKRPLSPLGDSMPPMAPEASRRDHKPSAARRPSLRQHYAGVVTASGGPHRQQVCARCSDPHVGSRAMRRAMYSANLPAAEEMLKGVHVRSDDLIGYLYDYCQCGMFETVLFGRLFPRRWTGRPGAITGTRERNAPSDDLTTSHSRAGACGAGRAASETATANRGRARTRGSQRTARQKTAATISGVASAPHRRPRQARTGPVRNPGVTTLDRRVSGSTCVLAGRTESCPSTAPVKGSSVVHGRRCP